MHILDYEVEEIEGRRKMELRYLSEKDSMEITQVFYIINCDWITQWKCFIFNKRSANEAQNSPNPKIGTLPPGPISNNDLFTTPENPQSLKPGLKKAVNYRGINE